MKHASTRQHPRVCLVCGRRWLCVPVWWVGPPPLVLGVGLVLMLAAGGVVFCRCCCSALLCFALLYCVLREHYQGPMTPRPSANTAPTTHTTTKATLTHNIEGMLPQCTPGSHHHPDHTGRRRQPKPKLGGWQPATRLSIRQRPKTCTACE